MVAQPPVKAPNILGREDPSRSHLHEGWSECLISLYCMQNKGWLKH